MFADLTTSDWLWYAVLAAVILFACAVAFGPRIKAWMDGI